MPYRQKDCGVYCIRNTISGRIYVGSSATIQQRWSGHRHDLRRGKHHSGILQRSWNKHGEAAFVFEILELIDELGGLASREQHWIGVLRATSRKHGLNVLPNTYSPRGHKHSTESRAKMAAAKLGRKFGPLSAEHRSAISAAKRGRPGRPLSPEARAKLSIFFKGRNIGPTPPERRAKLRAARLRTLERQRAEWPRFL